jgi:hypothetical protein
LLETWLTDLAYTLRFAVQLLQGMTEASDDLHFSIQALVH